MRVEINGLSWGVAGRRILKEADLVIEPGVFAGLIGPNGSGKSTLLRCLYRQLKPDRGTITMDGRDLGRLSAQECAKQTAVVLQEYPTDFQFSVLDLVAMGRNPHKGMFDRNTGQDDGIIGAALVQVGMSDFADRSFNTLSGGEKQRVIMARALAQQPKFLILDEPTNHLDIRYQLEVMELVKSSGITAIAALHDMNMAAAYCDVVHVMCEGEVVASGPPHEVLSPGLIRDVFGVAADVATAPDSGQLRINFALRSKQMAPIIN